ncbi:hypothetical protein [Amycolatopsis sp. NBC_01480]|uniref:hypothetical protein n=1 Tax=Amycolatopsis sp. NBC_01480 TaxID=2903562 RepID=UPI002E2A7494|nr:hypothetical protein [Amycolatopsis sp. NBC_01480]
MPIFLLGIAGMGIPPVGTGLAVRLTPTLAAALSASAFNGGTALGTWLGATTLGSSLGVVAPVIVGIVMAALGRSHSSRWPQHASRNPQSPRIRQSARRCVTSAAGYKRGSSTDVVPDWPWAHDGTGASPDIFRLNAHLTRTTSTAAPDAWRRPVAMALDGLHASSATPLPLGPESVANPPCSSRRRRHRSVTPGNRRHPHAFGRRCRRRQPCPEIGHSKTF